MECIGVKQLQISRILLELHCVMRDQRERLPSPQHISKSFVSKLLWVLWLERERNTFVRDLFKPVMKWRDFCETNVSNKYFECCFFLQKTIKALTTQKKKKDCSEVNSRRFFFANASLPASFPKNHLELHTISYYCHYEADLLKHYIRCACSSASLLAWFSAFHCQLFLLWNTSHNPYFAPTGTTYDDTISFFFRESATDKTVQLEDNYLEKSNVERDKKLHSMQLLVFRFACMKNWNIYNVRVAQSEELCVFCMFVIKLFNDTCIWNRWICFTFFSVLLFLSQACWNEI